MPIQSTACPKCGKEASEYEPNKWRCLHCGRTFIVTKPPDVHVTQYVSNGSCDIRQDFNLKPQGVLAEKEDSVGCCFWVVFCVVVTVIAAIIKKTYTTIKDITDWSYLYVIFKWGFFIAIFLVVMYYSIKYLYGLCQKDWEEEYICENETEETSEDTRRH
jgi:hypothetical protein